MPTRRSVDTFAKGIEGETEVRRILNNLDDIKVVENLYLETTNSTCQIDFVVISRKGIFVIEVKNITGTVIVKLDNARWRVNSNERNFNILNPVLQNSRHILNLRKNLHIDGIYHNVVVFSDKTSIINRSPEVINFLDLYSMQKDKLDLISESDVNQIYEYLEDVRKDNMYLSVKHNKNAKRFLNL